MLSDIKKPFLALVIQSPVALFCMGLSAILGYGISFLIFDYRSTSVSSSHYGLHLAVGLAYTALVFCAVNWDVLTHDLTAQIMTERMPLTLVISFAVGCVLLIGGMIWKEVKKPYINSRRGRRG